MKRTVKALAVTTLASLVYSPAALAVTNYPAIKPKGKGADPAALSVFSWLINHIPHVLFGICGLIIVFMAVKVRRERARQEQRREQLRELEARHAKEAREQDWESYRHQMFMRQQRALMSDSLRYDILKRDGYRCRICGATQADGVKLHVDHIIPVSKGGRTEPSNLQTLCERCNLGKSNKL